MQAIWVSVQRGQWVGCLPGNPLHLTSQGRHTGRNDSREGTIVNDQGADDSKLSLGRLHLNDVDPTDDCTFLVVKSITC